MYIIFKILKIKIRKSAYEITKFKLFLQFIFIKISFCCILFETYGKELQIGYLLVEIFTIFQNYTSKNYLKETF